MKLLICATEYYPYGSGIANVAYNIVQKLREKGINCTVCSPTGPDSFIGDRWLILNFGRIGLLYYWFRVSSQFKKNCEYDVVWLHQPMFLLKNPFLKTLSTIHITAWGHFRAADSLNYSAFLKFYLYISSIIENYCVNKISSSTKFITDSPKVSQEVKDIINANINCKYISNGVDTCKFGPIKNKNKVRNSFNIPSNCTVFLTVGRLAPQKKLFLMVDVFKKIQSHFSNCLLIIAGKGKLFQKLNDYVNEEHLNNIKLIGFVPDDDLPLLYSCADYFIMTSEYEGQPLTLLEAMASGLPCIVSDIPNLKIVEDANCGVTVNFSDEDDAIRKIIDFVGEKDSRYSINARRYAEEKLSWNIIAEQYLSEFEKLI